MRIMTKIRERLRNKFHLLACGVFILGMFLSVVSLLDIVFNRYYLQSLNKQEINSNIVLTANVMTKMINSSDKDLNHSFEVFNKNLSKYLPDRYSVEAEKKISINGVQAPLLFNGDHLINIDHSIPDKLNYETGAVSTIFVRSGDNFIRVSTSLRNYDGKRAVGTLLDHNNPAYKKVINGISYIGPTHLFGYEYLTKYIPIKDEEDTVIGIIFVGVDFISHTI